MQKAEERRQSRNKSTREYYKRLKERAAQGDDYAQGILDRQRAAIRASVKRWKENHPERHQQYQLKSESSERRKQKKRDYMKQRYALKKAQQS